jgi:hypothetical protein
MPLAYWSAQHPLQNYHTSSILPYHHNTRDSSEPERHDLAKLTSLIALHYGYLVVRRQAFASIRYDFSHHPSSGFM